MLATKELYMNSKALALCFTIVCVCVCVCLNLVCVSDGEESAGPDVSGEGAVFISGDAGSGRAGSQRAGESGFTGPGQSSPRPAL